MMEPPQTPAADEKAAADVSAAVSVRPVQTLIQRRDFQQAARALRVAKPGFILQMRIRRPGEAEGTRVGFTCSKKVGNAVARNRAKRRLREIARLTLPRAGRPDADYVLIGRRDATAALPFSQLQSDFEAALRSVHGKGR